MCHEKKKEKEIASIEDCVDLSIQGLKEYIKKSKERVIIAGTKEPAGEIAYQKI